MQKTIPSKCRTCGTEYELDKEPYMPRNTVRIETNWCPNCEDQVDDYFKEFHISSPKPRKPKPNAKNGVQTQIL
jgi:hypothetical protein